jgi:hypothetical protein
MVTVCEMRVKKGERRVDYRYRYRVSSSESLLPRKCTDPSTSNLHVGINGTKWVIGGFSVHGTRQEIGETRLAHVGKSDCARRMEGPIGVRCAFIPFHS